MYSEFKSRVDTDSSIAALLQKNRSQQVAENRNYIKDIALIVLYLAGQGLAFRGHCEFQTGVDNSGNLINKGNFLETVDLVSKFGKTFGRRIKNSPKNASYLSSFTQNELLQCAAELIRSDISDEIERAGYYSLMADETKDISKVEQISITVRYLSDLDFREEFLGFFPATNGLTAVGLADSIHKVLVDADISLDTMVEMSFDGASVMAGVRGGVQE